MKRFGHQRKPSRTSVTNIDVALGFINIFRQCRNDHSFYPEPALCTLRESLEGMSFNQSAADYQLITSWFKNKTLEVDSDYEEWKEKIRIIITSFSAAAAGECHNVEVL